MDALSVRIKERREFLGYSQEELAKMLGYKSRSTIAKIESGIIDIPQSKIELFADVLQTTPGYLMGWDDEEADIINALNIYKKDLDDGILTYKKIELSQAATLTTDYSIFRWEELLLSYFRDLNDLGMNEAIKRIEELTHLEKYSNKDGRISYPDVISILREPPSDIPVNMPDEYRGVFRPDDNVSIKHNDGSIINAAHADGEPTEEEIKLANEIMDNNKNWD